MIGVGASGPLGAAALPATEASLAEREALIVLACVDGVGPVTLARLIERLGSARAVLATAAAQDGVERLVAASRSGDDAAMDRRAAVDLAAAAQPGAPERTLRRLSRPDLRIVTLEDPGYPPRLRAIELPPHVLFVSGDPASLRGGHSVAVVGTRRPSDDGRRTAARIAAALARAGATVVSGLALGIDGAAHEAVVAERGITVGVLGGGHDEFYPPAHRGLATRIVDAGGAIVSELPPAIGPTAGTFPRRNRVISGLADAVVVVEAPPQSGALLTAGWALAQGRPCFVVPASIDSRTAAGGLSFLREYPGETRIVTGIPQLLEDLGLATMLDPLDATRNLDPPVAAALVELGDGARRVASALVAGYATADELVAVTDLPIGAVLAAITLLENRRLVVGAYGRYRPAGRLAAADPPPQADEPAPAA